MHSLPRAATRGRSFFTFLAMTVFFIFVISRDFGYNPQMKKLFLAFALLLFTSTTFAFTLTGTIADKLDQTGLESVQITLDGKKKRASDDKGVFTIPNIDITAGNPAEIVFSKDAYLDLAGTITQKKGALYFDGVRFGSVKYKIPQGGGVAIPDPDATYTLPDIELLPNPVPIIRGKITAIRGRDEMEQDLIWSKVKIYATENGELLEVDKETEGEYTVLGYLGTEENPRDINMTFEYPGYEDKEEYFEVKAKIIDKDTDIVFTVPTNASRMQENMEAMTGFGCNELMPKYLIGASCVENSELKGDASDVAMWL